MIQLRDKLLIGSAAIIMLTGGIVDSVVNRRFADSAVLNEASSRLHRIPRRIGAWTAVDFELSKQEQNVAGLSGYVLRQYENEVTGGQIELLLVCGPAGPVSVHPPTACFRGTGHELIEAPILVPVGDRHDAALIPLSLRSTGPEMPAQNESADVMQMAVFRNPYRRGNESLRVFWGWGVDGRWNAPDDPRYAFRGQELLFKLYVTHRWERQPGGHPPRVPERFMAEAFPVIRSVLNADRGNPLATTDAVPEKML